MAYTYAGQFGPEAVIATVSGATVTVPNATVTVYETDGTTKSTLYTDRTKGATAANPTATDSAGNLTLFTSPGQHVVTISGVGVAKTMTVTVAADPADLESAGTTRGDLGPSVGLDLERTGTGTGNNTNKSTFFNLQVTADDINQGPTFTKVDGFNVIHHFGGANAQGGRQAVEGNLFFDGGATNSSNPDRNYVGVQAQFIAYNDDGGTSTSNFKGAGFGSGSWAQLRNTAVFFTNLTGAEFNTLTDPSASERANYIAGIQIASEHQKRGYAYDCGIALSGLSNLHLGFRAGILIGDMNGGKALAADSKIMQVINHTTLTDAFDFTGVTFTGNILKTANVTLTATSLNINGFNIIAPAGNHAIELGRVDGTASTPFFDWHSGATFIDYDVRLQASGGTGTIGQGTLTVNALNLVTNCQIKSVSGNETTGAGSAALGANSPAVTNTAPYKWLKFTTSDGSQVYVPAWK